MGISRRQDRAGRNAGGHADPRAEGRTRHHGESSLSRAIHLCFAYIRRISPFDAALSLPPLGRHAPAPRAHGAEMGEAEGFARGGVSDARGRLASYSHAARSLVKNLASNESGATAIEYALIATLVS